MITLTMHIETHPRNSQLDFLHDIKFKDYISKLGTPMEFMEELDRSIDATKELEGTDPMPTDSQWNKILVESFPKSYQRYWKDLGKEYSDPGVNLLSIARKMQIHHNRLLEDEPDDESKLDKKEVDGDSEKTKSKTDEKKRKIDDIDEFCKSTAFSKPNSTSVCRIHGGHTWGDCNLNPQGRNYFPRDPASISQGSYQRGRGRGRGGGQSGGYQGPGQVQQHHYQWSGPAGGLQPTQGSGTDSYHFGGAPPVPAQSSAQQQASSMYQRVFGQQPPSQRHF